MRIPAGWTLTCLDYCRQYNSFFIFQWLIFNCADESVVNLKMFLRLLVIPFRQKISGHVLDEVGKLCDS